MQHVKRQKGLKTHKISFGLLKQDLKPGPENLSIPEWKVILDFSSSIVFFNGKTEPIQPYMTDFKHLTL